MLPPLRVDPSHLLPGGDLAFTAVRSSGPGGQNVNKVASKVELRFDLEGTTALAAEVKERLRALAGARLDADGRIVVRSQKTRDQQKNLADARDKLAALVRVALSPPAPRKATRKPRSADRRRLRDKHASSDKKAARRGDDTRDR